MKKLLFWGDAPTASTGFATVSREILQRVHEAKLFDQIDIIGINFWDSFYNRNEYPYNIITSRDISNGDVYGNNIVLKAIQKDSYDTVFILNDHFVVNDISKALVDLRDKYGQLVYYYPVDACVVPEAAGLIRTATKAVTYNEFSRQETMKAIGRKPLVIPHGCNRDVYNPCTKEEKYKWRHENFPGIKDDTFLVVQINRNNQRKDIARSILAFKKFKEKHPNSMYYVHTQMLDQGGDLQKACNALGLQGGTDIAFPPNFNLAEGGYPQEVLRKIYCMADCFFTTTLGEGHGLTITEAMSCGTPVCGPRNTSLPEILGQHEERGYMYECGEKIWLDQQCYRPMGTLDTIVGKLSQVYNERGMNKQQLRIDKALAWTADNTWDKYGKEWVSLISEPLPLATASTKLKVETI